MKDVEPDVVGVAFEGVAKGPLKSLGIEGRVAVNQDSPGKAFFITSVAMIYLRDILSFEIVGPIYDECFLMPKMDVDGLTTRKDRSARLNRDMSFEGSFEARAEMSKT